ncbi:MAG: hypothetical protein JXA04_01480 [Gammaproteobacteria bacterium]|nr:hypothetical protein [Gammaproteobacteria bacterium]
MLEKITTQTTYKIFTAIGFIIVALTPWFGRGYVENIEQMAVAVFEQSILTRLDLESTQLQYQSIQNAITASHRQSDDPDAVDYTASQVEQLETEAANLNIQIKQLLIQADTLEATRKTIITEFKIALVFAFVLMLIAMLLASFGLLGWIYHVRVFRERRRNADREKVT